ncbi:DUF465 domain-containing protein [Desulfuromonas carbonis]|uniref:YdcH family protein n=1 Tax=Desulfuromonas sp. DDH964 TaxID=1823759 RepID=UPI00078C7C2B|nr:YdcH family protein [Desulfuromonas sp. DDH964]AMV72539.1 hypothetical protein DBW_2199 [Desulfuromonas sp. DDH964]
MEEKDQTVVQTLFDSNPRFRLLYEEHRLLEKELNQLEDRPFLTPEDEIEKKKIQKLKLAGKDEMERIIAGHRH